MPKPHQLRFKIEISTYKTWFKKLKEEKALLENSLKPNSSKMTGHEIIEKALPSLRNYCGFMRKEISSKSILLLERCSKIRWLIVMGVFITPYINPTFEHNLLKMNEKGLLIYELKITEIFAKYPITTSNTP